MKNSVKKLLLALFVLTLTCAVNILLFFIGDYIGKKEDISLGLPIDLGIIFLWCLAVIYVSRLKKKPLPLRLIGLLFLSGLNAFFSFALVVPIYKHPTFI